MTFAGRLIVVSNRLPITVQKRGNSYESVPSSGGLVTALTSILRRTEGCWIGWTGTDYCPEIARQVEQSSLRTGARLIPVFLSAEERKNFYCGFANEVIWPLFHDLQSRCNFDPAYWDAYCGVNEKYADALAGVARSDDFVWVHDYHLMLLADCAGDSGLGTRLAYFHHIPFPPPDIFEKLPWRSDILRALLKFSALGFQTTRDRRNFVQCLMRFIPGVKLRRNGKGLVVVHGHHHASLGTFPIGIDFDEFAQAADLPEVVARAAEIRSAMPGRMLLGVDRLDYTKGIPERLKAFRLLLEVHQELRRKVSLVQIVVPSREDLPNYQDLKTNIEQLVSQTNGEFGDPGWVPVHLLHRQVPRKELLAFYRAADAAVVTPLKDGMNLVAKEFCAAQVEERGALILSEFAGAAAELKSGALLVNPYDSEALMEAIAYACRLSAEDRTARMRQLRDVVRMHDVFRWSDDFYRAAKSRTVRPASPMLPASSKVLSFASPVPAWKQAAGSFG
jgi:trehalose 6-phosphate synthase/phosphatase